eukprot:CAMPEP_0170526694 /NCGR_PEP_ID=MMETSP0209-20121228/12100_1 /TAXON_ID=665100 ORGANISM="Litonotus pictus, Strain P1" /NCGR_SAMPLE_ID=MMETSP0209 /ASSEMBLY_ACC=CAM_ASM_000301 /LENGTH=238 /DNA_ID=CAMNT_0010816667 /DNA_START=1482 /DNA_END=2195 /DNA_ORIENTATION=+
MLQENELESPMESKQSSFNISEVKRLNPMEKIDKLSSRKELLDYSSGKEKSSKEVYKYCNSKGSSNKNLQNSSGLVNLINENMEEKEESAEETPQITIPKVGTTTNKNKSSISFGHISQVSRLNQNLNPSIEVEGSHMENLVPSTTKSKDNSNLNLSFTKTNSQKLQEKKNMFNLDFKLDQINDEEESNLSVTANDSVRDFNKINQNYNNITMDSKDKDKDTKDEEKERASARKNSEK